MEQEVVEKVEKLALDESESDMLLDLHEEPVEEPEVPMSLDDSISEKLTIAFPELIAKIKSELTN